VATTKLLSCMGLTHRNDLTGKVTLGVDDHDHATFKQTQADTPNLTIVGPAVFKLQRLPCKVAFSIEKIQAALLQSPQPLEGIEADHRPAWLGWSRSLKPRAGWAWPKGEGTSLGQCHPPVSPQPGCPYVCPTLMSTSTTGTPPAERLHGSPCRLSTVSSRSAGRAE
jgi:hypothetical protein